MGRLSSGPFHAPEGRAGGEAPSKAQRNASGRKGSSSAICVAGVGFASSPVIAVFMMFLVYILEIFIDNTNARFRWELAFTSSWIFTFAAGVSNIIILYYVMR